MSHPICHLDVKYTKCLCICPPTPEICFSPCLDTQLLKPEIRWEPSLVSLFPLTSCISYLLLHNKLPQVWWLNIIHIQPHGFCGSRIQHSLAGSSASQALKRL